MSNPRNGPRRQPPRNHLTDVINERREALLNELKSLSIDDIDQHTMTTFYSRLARLEHVDKQMAEDLKDEFDKLSEHLSATREEASTLRSKSATKAVFIDAKIGATWSSITRAMDSTPTQSDTGAPPKRAEKLLYLFLPKKDRESIPGDLEEEYRTIILPNYGRPFAQGWYWWQAARSLWIILRGSLARLLKLGLFAKAAEWVSKYLST